MKAITRKRFNRLSLSTQAISRAFLPCKRTRNLDDHLKYDELNSNCERMLRKDDLIRLGKIDKNQYIVYL